MKSIFKKISAYFSEEPDLQKIYDDAYNASLLKQAHLEIVPGMITRTAYFTGEWILYSAALICFFVACYVWNGPYDGFIYNLTNNRPVTSATMTDDMITMYKYTSLLFLLLPSIIFLILARVSRGKHIHLQKLATIGKKIDEVAKNLEYRVEHKSIK